MIKKIELTDQEIKKAYIYWHAKYQYQEADKAIEPFLSDLIKPFVHGQQSQLKNTRSALFLSASTVADKAIISRAAYSKYEDSEKNGTITLNALVKAAEAMDCELVYAIRPKNRIIFSKIIWKKLLPVAIKDAWMKNCNKHAKPQALAFIAKRYMDKPAFRKAEGWSQRANMQVDGGDKS